MNHNSHMDMCTLCTRPSPHYLVWPGNKAKCGQDVVLRVQAQSLTFNHINMYISICTYLFLHLMVIVLLHSDRKIQCSNLLMTLGAKVLQRSCKEHF